MHWNLYKSIHCACSVQSFSAQLAMIQEKGLPESLTFIAMATRHTFYSVPIETTPLTTVTSLTRLDCNVVSNISLLGAVSCACIFQIHKFLLMLSALKILSIVEAIETLQVLNEPLF